MGSSVRREWWWAGLAVAAVLLTASGCDVRCKACVPLTRIHFTSKAGAPLAPRSLVVADQTGFSETYDCASALDGGAETRCTSDGVNATSVTGELTLTATAESGETVSTSVRPTYTSTGDGTCGPCLVAEVTLVLN